MLRDNPTFSLGSANEDAAELDVVVALRESSLARDLLILRTASAGCLLRGAGTISVDISSLRRLSSETIAALLWTRRTCGAHGIGFAVEGARPGLSQALQRCGLAAARGEAASWRSR